MTTQRFAHLVTDYLGLALALCSQYDKLRRLTEDGADTSGAELELTSLREVERLQVEHLARRGYVAEHLWRPTVAVTWGTVERVAHALGVPIGEDVRGEDIKALRNELVAAVPTDALDWRRGRRVDVETVLRGRLVTIKLQETQIAEATLR